MLPRQQHFVPEALGTPRILGTLLVGLISSNFGRDNHGRIRVEDSHLVADRRNVAMLQRNQSFGLDQNQLASCRLPQDIPFNGPLLHINSPYKHQEAGRWQIERLIIHI
jgi:hypothetical protein